MPYLSVLFKSLILIYAGKGNKMIKYCIVRWAYKVGYLIKEEKDSMCKMNPSRGCGI
jgi:hypothetical protein